MERDQRQMSSGTEDFEVIKEKIKSKPLNRKKLVRRTVITASMALIFGTIACVTILVLEPVINNLMYPKKEQTPITFPEEQEEVLPEDFLTEEDILNEGEDSEPLPYLGEGPLTMEQLEQFMGNVVFDLNDYKRVQNWLYEIAELGMRSMVTVSGVTNDVDWFNDEYSSTDDAYGVIVAKDTENLYILAPFEHVSNADSIKVVFNDGSGVEAEIKQSDVNIGYAIFTVSVNKISQSTMSDITVATLGSSNSYYLLGSSVVAVGSIASSNNSIGYGYVTSINNQLSMMDKNFKLCTTDIFGSTKATGIVMNLSGQVIGIIDNRFNAEELQNLQSFIGISELKKTIEILSRDDKMAHLGVYGMDVTAEISEERGIPKGAYVMRIAMDSPAMQSGILSGDVITRVNSTVVTSFNDLSNALSAYNEGATVRLTVQRFSLASYQEFEVEVTLDSMQ